MRFISLLVVFTMGSPGWRAQATSDKSLPYQNRHRPSLFSHELPTHPNRPRATLLPPLVSLFLPGFDQWYEGQYSSAVFYSGMAFTGLSVAGRAAQRIQEDRESVRPSDLSTRDNNLRSFLLGTQMYMAAGSLSAYTSFRSAVATRKSRGEYEFLSKEESTRDILLSPFEFSILKHPTTWVPLAALTGLLALGASGSRSLFHRNSFSGTDVFFASSYSYLAGTHEEALFRGWMMPVLMESWGSPFWSNSVTAAVFALAHLSAANPAPWPQFALGWYLGFLTQRNQWSLKESVFFHTWWDVIVFTTVFLVESQDNRQRAELRLPLIQLSF